MTTTHAPSQVVRQLLIDNAYGAEPVNGAVWPLYFASLPDGPKVADDAICVHDTVGTKDGRIMRTGETLVHEGFMVRVRADSANYQAGMAKAKAIAALFDTILRQSVTVDATVYTIQSITRTAPVSWAGQEPTSKRRDFFTVNCTITIREVP